MDKLHHSNLLKQKFETSLGALNVQISRMEIHIAETANRLGLTADDLHRLVTSLAPASDSSAGSGGSGSGSASGGVAVPITPNTAAASGTTAEAAIASAITPPRSSGGSGGGGVVLAPPTPAAVLAAADGTAAATTALAIAASNAATRTPYDITRSPEKVQGLITSHHITSV